MSKIKGGKWHAGDSPRILTPNYDLQVPGVDNLDPGLTINGITVMPTLRYRGGDANASTWPAWGYGETLNISGSGTAPTLNTGSPYLGTSDDNVKFLTPPIPTSIGRLGSETHALALAVIGTQLYAGSYPAGTVWRYDGGTTWTSIGRLGGDTYVYALAVIGTQLYAGSYPTGTVWRCNDKYYSASSTTFGDIVLEDFVIELIIKTPFATTGAMPFCGKGWRIEATSASILCALNKDTDISVTTIPNVYNHIFICGNRDENSTNSFSIYVQGVSSGTSNIYTLVATSLENVINFVIGSGDVSYVAMWKQSNWHQAGAAGPAEWATIDANRYALLTGSKPVYSFTGITSPTAKGSTSGTYQRKTTAGVTKCYYMGAYAPRFESVVDGAGKAYRGELVEAASQNKCLQSDAIFNATNWTSYAIAAITHDGANASDGYNSLDGTIGTVTNTQHGVTQAITVTAANWVLSCEARAGNKDWIYLADETVANATAYFQISTATFGTVGAGIGDKGVINYGGGLIRPWIRVLGTAAAHTFDVYSANADTDNDFAGDGSTVNTWFGAVQVELGNYPTSRIPTTTAAVTRAADSTYYTLASGTISNTEGALYLRFLSPTYTPSASKYLATLSTGLSTNTLSVFVDTNGRVNISSTSTGGTSQAGSVVEGSGSRCDNLIHEVLVTWIINSLKLYVDGVLIGTDTTMDPPTGITRLTIGADYASANQAGPLLVSDVQAFATASNYRKVR